jgi:exoribonuclease R
MRPPRRHVAVSEEAARLGLARLRAELDVPARHPAEVLAAAATAAEAGPRAVPGAAGWRRDRRDLPFVTIDPPGSRDLDQALHLSRRDGGGHRVHYAIADVAAFVRPGDPVDDEVRRRGVTLYLPDGSSPLHPAALSEGAASLLPGGDRPAVLWELDLDADGELVRVSVERAVIRSREALGYPDAQRRLEAGTAGPGGLELLEAIGRARLAREVDRGGISLRLASQEVERTDGGYHLRYRSTAPVEEWNAQLSILTGIAAAGLMAEAGTGIVRTLPPPGEDDLAQLRATAAALGVPWPADEPYAVRVRSLDPSHPAEAALTAAAATTLRGAAYEVVRGTGPVPAHGALAAPYAHVTAPLRRLVDRYGAEVALAVSADRPVPSWVSDRLDELPAVMAGAGQRAGRVDGAVVDLIEALLLVGREGERFAAVVVSADRRGCRLQLDVPAVVARLDAPLPVGQRATVELVEVDPLSRTVRFRAVPDP